MLPRYAVESASHSPDSRYEIFNKPVEAKFTDGSTLCRQLHGGYVITVSSFTVAGEEVPSMASNVLQHIREQNLADTKNFFISLLPNEV